MLRPFEPSSAGLARLRRALARKVKARRKGLRTTLDKRRRAANAELRRRRAAAGKAPQRRRRRWWWAVVVALLLLLLLLRDCSCTPIEAPVVAEVSAPAAPVEPEPVEVAPAARPPATGRIQRRDRPSFENELLAPLPWLAAYRMQVSARSHRLAECFVGAQRPGTLKWTASVEPGRGHVTEQTLEPTLQSDELTRQQRLCAFEVLSNPAYQLESRDERSTPIRVGMVIEF